MQNKKFIEVTHIEGYNILLNVDSIYYVKDVGIHRVIVSNIRGIQTPYPSAPGISGETRIFNLRELLVTDSYMRIKKEIEDGE